MSIRLLMPLLLLLLSIGLFADEADFIMFRQMLENSAFPENTETRRKFAEWIMDPVYPTEESISNVYKQLSDGKMVRFEIQKYPNSWYLIFRNQRVSATGDFPIWGRGNWIVKKDRRNGDFLQVKIFLQDDENSFVRIFPDGVNRSRMDMYMYGQQMGVGIIIPVDFLNIMKASFAQIVAWSERAINWQNIFPNPFKPGYRQIEAFVQDISKYSDEIIEVDDAAIDENGRNVFIETGADILSNELEPGKTGLNCSGYVKWIVDSINSSWTGDRTGIFSDVAQLRQLTERRNWNSWTESGYERDPRFGLDWNRNLAYMAESYRLKRDLMDKEKIALNVGHLEAINYKEDLGYELDDLESALYQLAAMYPDSVYLASINSDFKPPSDGPQAEYLHQYWHVLILAPWFDDGKNGGEKGRFRVAVLNTGEVGETFLKTPGSNRTPDFLQFIKDKAKEYSGIESPDIMVHLIRLRVPSRFHSIPLTGAVQLVHP